MEIKMRYTLIKNDATIGKNKVPFNDYAKGVVYGLMTACSEENQRYSTIVIDEGCILRMVGTEKQYARFKIMVENTYPDTCIFNYDYKK